MKISNRYKRGYIVLTVTSIITFLTFFTIIQFVESTTKEYQFALQEGNHVRSKYIAQGALEVVITTIKVIPLNILYEYGLLPESPVVPLKDDDAGIKEDIYIKYQVYEETGKINLNLIVNLDRDEPNRVILGMVERLSEVLGIDSIIFNALIDYIDQNDVVTEPGGYEKLDYEVLEPKRKIKNNRLHSLEELLLVPGFNQKILYQDLRTETQKTIDAEKNFTIEEQSIVDEGDFILSENVTTYLPYQAAKQDINAIEDININYAKINTIISLSEYLTEDIAKKILLKRVGVGGRFEAKEKVREIPELQQLAGGNVTIYERIADRITVEDRIYKITIESIYQEQSSTIMAIYDFTNQQILSYFE